MDVFSIIWLLVVIGFVVLPAVIDKKLKKAGGLGPGGTGRPARPNRGGQWPTPSAWPQATPEQKPQSPVFQSPVREKPGVQADSSPENEGLRGIVAPVVASSSKPAAPAAVTHPVKVTSDLSGTAPAKFFVNPEDMVIYSAIMNPKFEES